MHIHPYYQVARTSQFFPRRKRKKHPSYYKEVAGKNKNVLKHLLITFARYCCYILNSRLQKSLCDAHHMYSDTIPFEHHKTCTKENKKTFCYLLAKESLDIIDDCTFNELLEINSLGSVQIPLHDIIADDYNSIIEKIHYGNGYMLSHTLMTEAVCTMDIYDKYAANNTLYDHCIVCDFQVKQTDKHTDMNTYK